MSDIHHWYHVYTDGAWGPPWREHFQALSDSGLFEELSSFRIGLVGMNHERRDQAADLLKQYADVVVEEDQGWEIPTLHALWEDTSQRNPDCSVLYAHTKGASVPGTWPQDAWRAWLTENTISCWMDCERALDIADLAVPNWMSFRLADRMPITGCQGWSPGNFWWSRGAHIAKLPAPPTVDRWGAETWLGTADWPLKVYQVDARPFDFPRFFGPPPR